VCGAAFTADGCKLVVVPDVSSVAVRAYKTRRKSEPSGAVPVWDVPEQRAAFEWMLGFHPRMGTSGDGLRIATSNSKCTRVWDAVTGTVVADLPEGVDQWVTWAVLDHRGRRLASVLKTKVHVWDVLTRQITHTIPIPQGFSDGWFSPDGDVFIWRTNVRDQTKPANDTITVFTGWDIPRGREVFRVGTPGSSSKVTFSPDGKLFAFGDNVGAIHLFDGRTGDRVATLRGHSHWVRGLAFSPDGRRLYSAAVNSVLKTWDVGAWNH
jgi:WD40 repeat protein